MFIFPKTRDWLDFNFNFKASSWKYRNSEKKYIVVLWGTLEWLKLIWPNLIFFLMISFGTVRSHGRGNQNEASARSGAWSFSFLKWKPLILETWFLSHSLGNFVDLNFYSDHFFAETLRFVDIQNFPKQDMIHFCKKLQVFLHKIKTTYRRNFNPVSFSRKFVDLTFYLDHFFC